MKINAPQDSSASNAIQSLERNRNRRLVPAFAAVCAVGMIASAHGGVLLDGDFTSWTFNATGTATMTREASGGNPAARLKDTTISGATVFATGIKTDFSTDAALEGSPFVLSLDVLGGPGSFGQGQAIRLLVEQNASVYATVPIPSITFVPTNWTTLLFNGTFNAASFTKLIGAGAATPNFSGGVTTEFGFAGGNSGSGTLTMYYDNFGLQSAAINVHEPATLALLGLGLAGLGFSRRRQ